MGGGSGGLDNRGTVVSGEVGDRYIPTRDRI